MKINFLQVQIYPFDVSDNHLVLNILCRAGYNEYQFRETIPISHFKTIFDEMMKLATYKIKELVEKEREEIIKKETEQNNKKIEKKDNILPFRKPRRK